MECIPYSGGNERIFDFFKFFGENIKVVLIIENESHLGDLLMRGEVVNGGLESDAGCLGKWVTVGSSADSRERDASQVFF